MKQHNGIQHACDVATATAADLQCCAHSTAVLFVTQTQTAGGSLLLAGCCWLAVAATPPDDVAITAAAAAFVGRCC